jgi:hypothetical protein
MNAPKIQYHHERAEDHEDVAHFKQKDWRRHELGVQHVDHIQDAPDDHQHHQDRQYPDGIADHEVQLPDQRIFMLFGKLVVQQRRVDADCPLPLVPSIHLPGNPR